MKKIVSVLLSVTLAAVFVACNEPAVKAEKKVTPASAAEAKVAKPGLDQVAGEVDKLDAELETLLSEI